MSAKTGCSAATAVRTTSLGTTGASDGATAVARRPCRRPLTTAPVGARSNPRVRAASAAGSIASSSMLAMPAIVALSDLPPTVDEHVSGRGVNRTE
eukprot:scaffold14127_cov140-Isochrysis_galbana.AAC.1